MAVGRRIRSALTPQGRGSRSGRLRHVLESRGATFRADEVVEGVPADADGVRAGRNAGFPWFYDPDGNKMEFCRVLGTPDLVVVDERQLT